MLKQQLRAGHVLKEDILALFDTYPREAFVPEAMKPFAYSDLQLDLGHGERMLTPLEEGTILQALNLKGHEIVLEVGTGSGFLTCLLAKQAKKVISIEYHADFIAAAEKNLKQQHCDNVELIKGDGRFGLLEKAPFDVIVMTGAIDQIDKTLTMQILPEGRLVTIVGKGPIMSCRMLTLNAKGQWRDSFLFETNIPLLIDKQRTEEFIF